MRNPKFRIWNKAKKQWEVKDFHLIGEVMLLQGFPIEQLDDLEVNQFTGLKDRHGNEIYEGDIVSCAEHYPVGHKPNYGDVMGAVVWHDCGWWIGEDGEKPMMDDTGDRVEVIGNVHENPSLLGSEK